MRRRPPHSGVELCLDIGIERAGGGHPPVFRLDPAAGKDELARHEAVSSVPLAHQHPGAAGLRSLDQNERRRVARAKRPTGPGGLGHVRSPSAPKPCMHKAHCWPTTAPLAVVCHAFGPNRREKRVSMTENYAVIGHRRSLGPPRPCGKTAATHWTKPGLVKGAIIGHVPGNTAVIWGMLV